MTLVRAGALVLGVACTFTAGPADAQNAAALAKLAARNADAFDTLVTPDARRALERLTEDDAPAEVKPGASRAAASLASASETTSPGTRAPAQSPAPAPATAATAATPEPQADSAAAIREIFAHRAEDLLELRIVAAGQVVPALSEPFRAGEHSRLFITFERTKLALASPPALAGAGATFAGVDIAERDGGVRIALDVADLGAYELAMAGDTAVLRLTRPSAAVADAATDAPLHAARPDDLALMREAANAGWSAFRRDVGAVASGLGGFLAQAGKTIASAAEGAWSTASGAAVTSARWLAGSLPFASIARALVLLALLGAPPLLVLRFLRRRQSAMRAPAEVVGPETHARAAEVAPKADGQPKAKKERKERKPTVTRTTADARLWAARTLAANGADVAEIARQTGLSREAAILLVRTAARKAQAR